MKEYKREKALFLNGQCLMFNGQCLMVNGLEII